MRQLRVAIIGSGILASSVSARLSAEPDAFQQPPADVPDASVADAAVLEAALSGTDALFVELPADPSDPDCLPNSRRVVAQLVKSAQSRGIGHVICCTSASPLQVTGASARRMDVWAEAEQVWRQSGLNVTYLVLPTFYQELLHCLRPRLVSGNVCIAIPCGSTPFDMMDVDDAAVIVASCLKLGPRCYGRCLPLSAGKITVKQLADTMSQVLGVQVLDQKVSCEQLRFRGDPTSVDIANTFEFIQRVDQRLSRSVVEEHLGQQIATFAEWCARNRDRLLQLLSET